MRESEERLRLATQAAHLCTWEMDIPSQTYKLGDNFEDVVGFSRDYLPEKAMKYVTGSTCRRICRRSVKS